MKSNKRPNVIWIFGDQHRAQTLGFNGDPNVHTPHIDRMAAEGIVYSNAVTNTPLCCPARGTLLTSRYPHNCVNGHEQALPQGMPTIATAMKANGYHTAYIGKWHLAGFKERTGRAAMHITAPDRRGDFDHWVGYENNNSQFDCWVHGGKDEEAFHYRLPGYETDALTELFIDHLRECAPNNDNGDKPFFAVLSVQPPHNPYVAPEEDMQRHTPGTVELRPNVPPIPRYQEEAKRTLAGYHAMVENLDYNVGRIRQALAELDLTHDTHIIFFSDHGDMMGSHGQFKKMSPMEESIKVPMVFAGMTPYYEQKCAILDQPIGLVDLAPTTMGLCGLEAPQWMEGTDYSSPHVRGGAPIKNAPTTAYLTSGTPTKHADSIDRPWRGVLSQDGWKYVIFENTPWLLFNLNEDPYEFVNLAHNSRYAKKRLELQSELEQWIERTGDIFSAPEL